MVRRNMSFPSLDSFIICCTAGYPVHGVQPRDCVYRIRIFRGPMAETQWPKGMFLIYRTVAGFFCSINTTGEREQRIYGNGILFILFVRCACWISVPILRRVFWGSSRFVRIWWYVFDRKEKEKNSCLRVHLPYISYLRNTHEKTRTGI